MKKKVIYLVLAVLLCIGVVYSCSKSVDNSAPATVTGTTATIQNFAFAPATVNIKVGGSVTWTNMDNVAHTVTSTTGAFDSGPVAAGQTFNFKFNTAGTYVYHCTIHSMMANATVVVSN